MTQDKSGVDRRRFLAGAAAGVGGAAVLGGLTAGTAAADTTTTTGSTITPAVTTTTPAMTVLPTDQQYPDLVRALNARYTASPDNVQVVSATSQIAPIVAAAVKAGKQISVRGGGHCLEDFVYNADVKVIIDLTNMNNIYYDSTYNAIAVESGARLLDVYTKLYQTWGVTIPGGIAYSVGVGGHIVGGGWGWLSRRNGLTVDHLYGVEVVLVDATGAVRTVVATRDATDPNHDLWWAHTGGGGGNFGVITRYLFRSPGATGTNPSGLLPRPPASVLLSAVGWNWSTLTKAQFQTLMQNYASWHAANSGATSPNRFLTSFLVMNHISNGQIGMITQVDATAPNAQQILNDYLTYMNNGVSTTAGAMTTRMGNFAAMPQFAAPVQLPWLTANRYTSTTNALLNDPTLRAEYKSAYMKSTFPQDQMDAIYTALTRSDINNPDLSIQFTAYGGVTSGVDPAATAVPHRGATFKIMYWAQWSNPADDALYIGWSRTAYSTAYAATGGVPVPNTVTDGCYVNYPDADLSDPAWNTSTYNWYDLYYKGNYPRLQSIKKCYDPLNIFRHRQSIVGA